MFIRKTRWNSFLDGNHILIKWIQNGFGFIFNGGTYNINLIDNIQFRNKQVKIKAVTKDGTEG